MMTHGPAKVRFYYLTDGAFGELQNGRDWGKNKKNYTGLEPGEKKILYQYKLIVFLD